MADQNTKLEDGEKLTKVEDDGEDIRRQHTYFSESAYKESQLSESHRNYLLERHGTIDLDPLPSEDPADPYNWSSGKKHFNLALVSFHACMTTFMAAGIIPAFEDISQDLGTSLVRASYLTAMQIAVLGYGPLFWRPISDRYGRRPVWLVSTLFTGLFNIGCALSKTYGAMAACRCLSAFFISPAIALGSGVVVETFFKKQRAQKLGIWTLMVTLGPPGGPFLMGFVAFHVGYRWIYWVFAIVNGVQFFAYLFFGPETRYLRAGVNHHGGTFRQEYLNFRRIDPKPFTATEFIQPLFLFGYLAVLIPTVAYSIVFNFASVFLTVEIPQIFIPKFHFNSQQLGLQFLGMTIGSVIGEQLAGPLSDFWMQDGIKRAQKARQSIPVPEYRLWLSHLGFILSIVGLIVFGVRTAQAPEGQWNVTPIVGIGIAAAGNQIVTTVLITYAIDCHPDQADGIGVFVNVVRSTWGFIGPFWFPTMVENIGIAGSAGLMAGLIFVTSMIPMIACQILKPSRRAIRDSA